MEVRRVEGSESGGMKLGKRFARVGFVVGFMGSLLFYSIPYTLQSHTACPLCPYVDVPLGHPLLWLQIGLSLGLIQGLVFAMLGFAIGYSIFRIKQST
jgi:hypothetical protein